MARSDARPTRFAQFCRWNVFALLAWSVVLLEGTTAIAQTKPQPAARPANGAAPAKKTTAPPRQAAPRPQAAVKAASAQAAAPQAGTPQAAAPATGQIVALVNDEAITREELANACLRRFGKTVVEGEINKYLIRQECQTKGVQISEQEIDAEVAKTAAGLRLTPDRFYEVLRDEREIDRQQYRDDIVWPMLALRKLAADQLVVTNDDLQRVLESEFGPQVQVRMIAVADQGKAAKLHRAVMQKPADFDSYAKDYSEDPNSAAARGLIPPIRKHVGDPEIERIAFSMKPGDISQVIAVANQYLILKCERVIPATQVPQEQRESVVRDLKERILDTKLRAVAAEKFRVLQEQANVVNVMNDKALQEQMPGVAATINGGKIMKKDLAEQCLVRHGMDVLDGEINRKMLTQALRRRSIEVTGDDLRDEVERAAMALGFVDANGKAKTAEWIQQVTKEGDITPELYIDDVVWPSVALKKLVTSKIEVTQEDLDKGFTANYGERVEVLAIVMNDQRTAHDVFQKVRANPTQKFFGELANQYSVEPVSRANFGQVPPVRRYGGQPMLEEEAFKLKPGEFSGVLALGDSFVLLYCLGFTKPVVEDVKIVQDELVRDITEKKMRLAMTKEFDTLKESSKIDNFLAKTTNLPRTAGEVQPASHNAPAKTR
jgi:parvulin-like peptidyl-prolyl isomerase